VADAGVLSSAPNLEASQTDMLRVVPNPVKGSAEVQLQLRNDQQLRLALYDLNGRLVKVLDQGWRASGAYSIPWSTTELAQGVYILQLSTETGIQQQKVVVQ
jgi:hypothetical protein